MPPDPAAAPPVLSPGLVRAFEALCPDGIRKNVPLAQLSRWRIGDTADLIVRPAHRDQCVAIIRLLAAHNAPFVVIGSTSNLLFADEGLRAACIQIGPRMAQTTIADDPANPAQKLVHCQSGRWVPGLARDLMRAGLNGAAHICGIPGSLGGLVCMNGGSLRQSIGDAVRTVTSIDRQGRITIHPREECGFAYRASRFQSEQKIITDVTLALPSGPAPPGAIRREMLTIMRDRRRRFPRDKPHCGSVFISDPAAYALHGSPGALIERCGLKGAAHGGARVSGHHANFIVNRGDATAADVLSLIVMIQDRVASLTGHVLRSEIRYVTPAGGIAPAGEAITGAMTNITTSGQTP